jgi:hypothetical protein
VIEDPVSGGYYSIEFSNLPWEPVSKHARQKCVVIQERVVRLLELEEGFQEVDWCHKSHVGYVVDGRLRLDFVDHSEILQGGDGVVLAGGEEGKHKAAVVCGPVTLFLVEPA